MTRDSALFYIRTHGFNREESEAIFDYYVKNKIFKYNAHDGYELIHGAYFDRDILTRALLAAKEVTA